MQFLKNIRGKKRKISCQNLTFFIFWFFPCLHYFVNFLVNYYSNVKFCIFFNTQRSGLLKTTLNFIKWWFRGWGMHKNLLDFFYNTLSIMYLLFLKSGFWKLLAFLLSLFPDFIKVKNHWPIDPKLFQMTHVIKIIS